MPLFTDRIKPDLRALPYKTWDPKHGNWYVQDGKGVFLIREHSFDFFAGGGAKQNLEANIFHDFCATNTFFSMLQKLFYTGQ